MDTDDHEDHTFCGIFFDLRANDKYPLSYLEISSLCVRGQLGPLTVWTRPGGHGGRHDPAVHDETQWTNVYEKTHNPSFNTFVELQLDVPFKIAAGDTLGVYIHSTLEGDQSIVYDDQRRLYGGETAESERDDGKLVILPGTAHLSNKPFGRRAPWGGDALRQGRLFVGRVNYGVRWMLWNPETHGKFPLGFRAATEALMMGGKRPDCLLYHLGDEILFYVMNRCNWDWFGTKMSLDEDKIEQEKKNKAAEAQRRKESMFAEMFRCSVEEAKQMMRQMDPYMLQHIHQQLEAGNQIIMESSDDEEYFDEDEDEEESDSEDESDAVDDDKDAYIDALESIEDRLHGIESPDEEHDSEGEEEMMEEDEEF